jgi:hypothetical protein
MEKRPSQHTIIPAASGWSIVWFGDDKYPDSFEDIIAWDVKTQFDEESGIFSEVTPINVLGTPDERVVRWYQRPDGKVVDRHNPDKVFSLEDARKEEAEIRARVERLEARNPTW